MKDEIPVLINLLSIAHYDQAPDFPVQFMTKGVLSTLREGGWLLTYQETQTEDEDSPAITSDIALMMTPKQVTMTRSGPFRNMMVFSKGRRFEGIYSTPYGEMPMAVFAREVESGYAEGRGSLHLKYDLEFQGMLASVNELHMEFISEDNQRKGGTENEKADQ